MLKNLIVAALFVFIALPAQAGDCHHGGKFTGDHKEAMKLILVNEVGLDAATVAKVEAIFSAYRIQTLKAGNAKTAALAVMVDLVERKSHKLSLFEGALKNYREAKEEWVAAKKAKHEALTNLLDARQLVILKVHMHAAHEGHGDAKADDEKGKGKKGKGKKGKGKKGKGKKGKGKKGK